MNTFITFRDIVEIVIWTFVATTGFWIFVIWLIARHAKNDKTDDWKKTAEKKDGHL